MAGLHSHETVVFTNCICHALGAKSRAGITCLYIYVVADITCLYICATAGITCLYICAMAAISCLYMCHEKSSLALAIC